MENEVFTPLSDITGQSSARKAVKFADQPEPRETVRAPRRQVHDPDKAKKIGQVHFKAQHGIIVAFFTFILILHVLGIYLFTSGFLLTRLVLDHKSECALPPVDSANAYTAGDAGKGCWHPKTFEKAVVIIVDALRYDFTVPFPEQFEPIDLAAAAENPPQAPPVAPRHFHNAFPVLYETAKNQPQNAFLLPFIADPPTATMQRLKGLTTGTLPTFIDVGSNFAGQEIEEDNLVGQMKNASKRMVHLGDDTWHALFPNYFEPNLTHAYDSFNVWDLHTVDNGVTEHIFPLLKAENATQWDVIFGHYLGVDHAGHRYGPDHPAMTAKLNQMDDVFRRMIQEIDDDTLLVVMGDHGMDGKGDHGGESDDEIQAALWMYSKKGVFGRSYPAYITPPANAKTRPVGQIDLVPTLSLLLGLPIPFNNLGKPIEEAFIGKNGDDYKNLAAVNRLTAAQIHNYQHEYAKVRGIADSARASSLSLWKSANDAWNSLGKSKANSDEMRQAYEAFGAYQRDTLRLCRDLWARFDIPRMVSGVVILAASLIVVALYARILHGDRADVTPVFFTRGAIGLVLGGILGLPITIFMPEDSRSHILVLSSALTGIIGSASTFYALSYRMMPPMPNNIWGWTSAFFTLALSGGFAANSFTIWEDEILLHFLTTFGVLALISSFRQKRIADRTLGAYHSILFTVLLRVASFSRLCREEQMPYCKSTYYGSALSTTSAPWQLAIPVAAAILIPTFIKSYYDGTKSYQHNATLWIGLALRFGLLLSAAYWTLDAADDGEWAPAWSNIIGITKRLVAQIVLAIALGFGYSIYNWSKPLLNVIIDKDGAGVDENGKPKEAVTILGFANVHGSRYALLITIWYLAIAVLQKPMGAGAIGILVWQLFSLFEIIDTNNLRQSAIGPVVLGLLGSFHFFKTGHQATLSSIQWESAFIPLAKIRYPWTPIIVLLNTFGAQILQQASYSFSMKSAQHQHVEENLYGILIEEDLIDDSTGIIPMVGLKTPLSLKDRFARRLSKMLGAKVDIQERRDGNAMDIYLTRNRCPGQPSVGLDDELRKFVRALEEALAAIAKHADGPHHVLEIACDELWDAVLLFNYSKVETIIQNIKKTFQDNQETMEDLITRMFGMDDPELKDSMLDRELGDGIISLSQQITSFNGSMKELNKLIQTASGMTRTLLHMQERIRSLLEKTRFASKLYELICTLGFPERVHSTTVRSARASEAFRNVTFHFRPSSPGKTVSFATPVENPTNPSPPHQRQEKSKRRQRFEAAATTPKSVDPGVLPHPQPAISSQCLPTIDLALNRLQPTVKQETTQLIRSVLQKKLLPVQTSAWYAFGFVTTRDEDEEQQLAGLYMALLQDNLEEISRELQIALENNTLVTLFDKHDYGHFRELFPYLATFLTTAPAQRSTVWRLRQFIEDPLDDVPPACLQRDYGFKLCRQREEVLHLKKIYTRMLRKLGPRKLHTACIHGQLFKTAVEEGVVDVDSKDKRFLSNDYGSPFLGLDNEGGTEAYRGPFYRRTLKM
ncbi:hypothetical protein ACET3X_006296 [Alternaria dauci]|uniref:GPI ethanolamine phosphate transferase 3 n=1 Tax=Alternaria dauci TaxID=48095 RepID=A0ABR3UHV3_9PLEO